MASNSSVAELILKIVADSSGLQEELAKVINAENSVAKNTEETGKKLESGGLNFSQTVKQGIKPLMDLRMAFVRIGAVAGLAWGATVGAAKVLNNELVSMRDNAIDLGITLEQMSMKKYGFNIDTPENRMAGQTGSVLMADVDAAWEKTKIFGANVARVTNTFFNTRGTLWDKNYADMWAEATEREGDRIRSRAEDLAQVSEKTIAMTKSAIDTTMQLTLSETEFKKWQLNRQLEHFKNNLVEEEVAVKYSKAVKDRILQDQGLEYLRMQAQVARARGDNLTALNWEQQIEITLYRRTNKEMVESKKSALAEMARIETLHSYGLKTTMESINELHSRSGEMVTSSLQSFFGDAWRGELKSANEYFADFGTKILDSWSTMLAEMIAKWIFANSIIGPLLSLPGSIFGGGGATGSIVTELPNFTLAYHAGGYIRKAHEGLSNGEVPIIAQSGEGILSRNGMATLGSADKLNRLNSGEGITGKNPIVINMAIQAWDTRDITRNQKSLASGIGDELRKNGEIRRIMREYA